MNTFTNRRSQFSTALLFLCIAFGATNSGATEKLTIQAFEASPFFATHKAYDRDNWKLKSGGTAYNYAFRDVDNTMSGIGVNLTNDPNDIQRISVTFHGISLSNTASFTNSRRHFLENLISATFPEVPKNKLLALVRERQSRDYPGGGETMERLPVGKCTVRVGSVGGDIVIIINR